MKPLAREDPAWLYERVAELQRELEAVRQREAELADFIDNASVAIHAVAAETEPLDHPVLLAGQGRPRRHCGSPELLPRDTGTRVL